MESAVIDRFTYKNVCLALFAFCVSLNTSQLLAQRNLKDIPDPDPELERKSFIVADGFEVNLFAADPKIAKPIQMNFGPDGRLWIASSEIYPHIKPGEKANDRILVVEDKDGDGVSDSTTVFANGLLIPTAVAPGDGGVYVANSTELMHFSDTNGDGKADKERVVLSGFGTEDTHHILHTLRWGPDGMLYFNQSIYIHSHIETPWGVRRLNAGGIWQMRTETMELEVFARGWVNTWGHHFDQWGQSFVTDGAGGEGINYAIPGAAYPTAQGLPRIFHGLNPGSPKYCGVEIVSGRHLPDDWQGNVLTNDFRGHRVCRYIISDDGAGYAAREQVELIKSKHVAFRPIDVKMGPDGAIYIADWYNPIIQHGEVDFRDPRRDHVHGRIWRVTRKGSPLVKNPQLTKASVPQLLEHLKSPEDWTRQNAKRVLKEAGAKPVVGTLKKWVADLDKSDKQFERNRLEGLWVYQSVDVAEPQLLNAVLRSPKPECRAAAVRVLKHWFDEVPNGLELLSAAVLDEHPRVRLEAVRVLGNIGTPNAVEIAMGAIDSPVDRFLDYALWLTAWENREKWLTGVETGEVTFGGKPSHMTFALMAVGSRAVVPRLLALLNNGRLSAAQLSAASDLFASQANAAELGQLLTAASKADTEANLQIELVQLLATAARQRGVKPAGDLTPRLASLINSKVLKVQIAVSECLGYWRLKNHDGTLAAIAADSARPLALREAAVRGLTAFGPSQTERLIKIFNSEKSFEIRSSVVSGIVSLDVNTGAKLAVELLAASNTDDPSGIVSTFLGKKGAAAKLTAALKGKTIHEDVARLALRAVDASGRNIPPLKAALMKAGGVTGRRELTPALLKELVAQVASQGSASRGEAIFRRADLSCLKCHAIGGAGGRVGPDIASIGGSAQVDYLIESLLVPNKKVKEGYNTIIAVTDKGRSFSGVKVRQTNTSLILRDAEDREISVALKSIDEQVNGASLMPAGLIDKLTQSELVDLVRFLSELGKVGKFQVSRARVVRRWQTLIPNQEASYRLRRTRLASVAQPDPAFTWKSTYSTVAGELPLLEQPLLPFKGPFQKNPEGLAIVRFEFDISTAGEIDLAMSLTDGVTMWLDGDPIEPQSTRRLNPKTGRHQVTLAVNTTKVKDTKAIIIHLNDVPGSTAQVQLVSGK
jgi:putative heme-binding domain-containing protein